MHNVMIRTPEFHGIDRFVCVVVHISVFCNNANTSTRKF
jgi:hypothetical protein